MTVKCCLDAYIKFDKVKETKQFTIVDGPERLTKTDENDSILLVLDSSFNPPHWGHYTLIKKSYEYYHQLYPDKEINVLLLLSVQNADKAAKPASFDKRVEMMCVMGGILTQNFDKLSCSVGLTIFGKFIDKDKIIRDRFFSDGKIIYLVGFDTITRIFDPKYYTPETPAIALKEFMKQTEFCCLTRHDDESDNDSDNDSEETYNVQLNYSKEISDGKYEPLVPREWGSKVNVLLNDPKYSNVSSSAIRKVMSQLYGELPNNEIMIDDLKEQLPNEIVKYILRESGVKSIFSS